MFHSAMCLGPYNSQERFDIISNRVFRFYVALSNLQSQCIESFCYSPYVKKSFQTVELHAQTHYIQTSNTKKILENSQRKMTHCLHDCFSPCKLFKICMIAKSKNDSTAWQNFQHVYMECIWQAQHRGEKGRGPKRWIDVYIPLEMVEYKILSRPWKVKYVYYNLWSTHWEKTHKRYYCLCLFRLP